MDTENDVEPSAVEVFCKEHKIKNRHFISAKHGTKVEEMFESVIKAALDKKGISQGSEAANSNPRSSIRVGKTATTTRPKDKCSC